MVAARALLVLAPIRKLHARIRDAIVASYGRET
jgi:hypothetical protein